MKPITQILILAICLVFIPLVNGASLINNSFFNASNINLTINFSTPIYADAFTWENDSLYFEGLRSSDSDIPSITINFTNENLNLTFSDSGTDYFNMQLLNYSYSTYETWINTSNNLTVNNLSIIYTEVQIYKDGAYVTTIREAYNITSDGDYRFLNGLASKTLYADYSYSRRGETSLMISSDAQGLVDTAEDDYILSATSLNIVVKFVSAILIVAVVILIFAQFLPKRDRKGNLGY